MTYRIFLLICLFLISNTIFSQIVRSDYDSKDFQALINSELNVVLTGQEEYDENIKSAIEKYWEITDFKFITKKEALYDIKDETKSFLLTIKMQMIKEVKQGGLTTSTKQTQQYKYWLCIVKGGEKRISSYTDNDAIALSPYNLWCGEKRPKDAAYRLNYMVKGLNDGISFIRDNKFRGGFTKVIEATIKNINSNAPIIKEKTLIINKDTQVEAVSTFKTSYSDVYNEKDFIKNYPYRYEFVDEDEYLEILSGNSDEYLCLLTIVEINKHVHIYEPSTKRIVYYGWQMGGGKFDKGDIKDLLEYKK